MTVGWDLSGIEVCCYFDDPITDEDRESMEAVETELLADFLPETGVQVAVHRADWPQEMALLGARAYWRREPPAGMAHAVLPGVRGVSPIEG
jgi:hypothetical protein